MKVTFVSHSGNRKTLEAPGGVSLVEIAMQAGVEGIDAECGGACSCGTCQIMIAEEWVDRLPPPALGESDMLEAFDRQAPTWRLACQVRTSAELDGLVVTTPEKQA